MFNWLKGILLSFTKFFKAVFNAAVIFALSELKEIALETVKELESVNLTDEQKRKEAFNRIKASAISKGLSTKDSIINLILEMSLTALKNGLK